MTEEEIEAKKKWAAERAIAILREHFENVVVIVTAPLPNGMTLKLANYSGNIYACIGMADVFSRKWIDSLVEDDEG